MPDELAFKPAMPEQLKYLWDYFLELHASRASNGFGPSPLQFSDIEAWSRLMQVKLDRWEVLALIDLDKAYLTVYAANDKGNSNGN